MAGIVLPSAARADDPDVRCGELTGDVTVELGHGLPLPNSYNNPTDATVTFNVIDDSVNIFNFPSPLVDPRFKTLVLAPHTTRDIPDLNFPLAPSTLTGTDHVVFDVFASARIGTVSKIWGAIKCGFTLTVIPPKDVIQVPVRWCAVEGSPQAAGVKGPTSNGGQFKTAPGTELLRLLQRINDEVFFPQSDTHILFRSASAPQGIPVIDDPDGVCPSDCTSAICQRCKIPGVFDPDPLSPFLRGAVGQCRQAWDKLYTGQPGTILINATALIGDDGVAEALNKSDFDKVRAQVCKHPAAIPVDALQSIQAAVVFDPAEEDKKGEIVIFAKLVPTLSHELGHTLTLGHGDGIDNNMDGTEPPTPGRRLYDVCDPLGVVSPDFDFPVEDQGSKLSSIMDYNDSTVVTPLQKDTLRLISKLVPGASFTNANDPAASLIAPPGGCDSACPTPPDISLTEAGVAVTPSLGVTSVWHRVRGEMFPDSTNDYLAFVDLDNNAATGCDPSILFPDQPGFLGAELVSRINISVTGNGVRVTPTIWRCAFGQFEQISDPGIQARVLKPHAADVHTPGGSQAVEMTVAVSVPDIARGPIANSVRLQAAAARAGGAVDRLPATGRGGVISLVPPGLPQCTVTRPLQAPGERAIVKALNLTPNKAADVYLGGRAVATGFTSATGEAAIHFVIPASSRQGLRPVAVILRDGAESATCAIIVQGKPVSPGTVAEIVPPPSGTGWNNSDVTVKLTAVDISGGPGIRDLTYTATGAQAISSTTVTDNPASIALSAEGETDLSFFGANRDGVTETAQATTVKIDKTKPVITFTGNAGSYGIMSTVDIACAATDVPSGILRTTCSDIHAPAYTFAAGTNNFKAQAVDFAFNITSVTTSFMVDVTYSDLCQLTKQLSGGTALGGSLCTFLTQAKGEQAAGLDANKADRIKAYIDGVQANAPGVFSQTGAQALSRLATGCLTGHC